MADDADIAQEYERLLTEESIERAKASLAPPSGITECEGCGDEIEAERRRVLPSARRCIECERRRERFKRLFSRRK